MIRLLISYSDVFYIYPTVFTDKKKMSVGISQLKILNNVKKVKRVTKFQGSAWAEAGRMFVYHIILKQIYEATPNSNLAVEKALLEAYKDVKAAFRFYLEHYNNGRANHHRRS